MLYSEFLQGTQASDNIYTYSEYERINKIYNASNILTKEDAYRLYNKPTNVITELLNNLEEAREQARDISYKYAKLEKDFEALTEEHRKEKAARISLQATIDEATNMIHKTYYLLTD